MNNNNNKKNILSISYDVFSSVIGSFLTDNECRVLVSCNKNFKYLLQNYHFKYYIPYDHIFNITHNFKDVNLLTQTINNSDVNKINTNVSNNNNINSTNIINSNQHQHNNKNISME